YVELRFQCIFNGIWIAVRKKDQSTRGRVEGHGASHDGEVDDRLAGRKALQIQDLVPFQNAKLRMLANPCLYILEVRHRDLSQSQGTRGSIGQLPEPQPDAIATTGELFQQTKC